MIKEIDIHYYDLSAKVLAVFHLFVEYQSFFSLSFVVTLVTLICLSPMLVKFMQLQVTDIRHRMITFITFK